MSKKRVCHYCGEPATTKDHIVPVSKAGTSNRFNLVPSCLSCNSRKGQSTTTCRCPVCQNAIDQWALGIQSARDHYTDSLLQEMAQCRADAIRRGVGPMSRTQIDLMNHRWRSQW